MSLTALRERLFPSKGFRRHVTLIASGSALGQALTFLATPLLTRLYDPEAFGIFGLLTTFNVIATVAVTLRLEVGIVGTASDEDAAQLTRLAFIASLALAPVLAAIMGGLIYWGWFGFGHMPWLAVPMVFIGLMSFSSNAIIRCWLLRQQAYTDIAKVPPIQNLMRLIAQSLLGFWKMGWMGLAIGEIIGYFGGMRMMMKKGLPSLRATLLNAPASSLKAQFLRFKNYPLYTLPSSLLDTFSANLPVPLLLSLYGPGIAGQFVLAQRVLARPLSLISNSVSDVFYTQVSKQAQDNPEATLPLFLKTVKGLLLATLLPMLAIVWFMPWLFSTLFGAEWRQSGELAAASAAWFVAQSVVSPVSVVVFVANKQYLKLGYDFVSLILTLTAFWIGRSQQLNAVQTIGLLSGGKLISYCIYFGILLYITRRLARGG